MGLFVEQSGFNTGYWVIAAVLVLAGWAVMYVASRRALKRALEELRRESEMRIRTLEAEVRSAVQAASLVGSGAVVTARPAAQSLMPNREEEITPELLLVIAAAVTAFLGKKVRVRSARLLPNPEIFSAWAQQGRVFVQASHNLAQRGH